MSTTVYVGLTLTVLFLQALYGIAVFSWPAWVGLLYGTATVSLMWGALLVTRRVTR